MNVKILTTRYKTPSFIKLIGSILFIAVVVLMIAMPVFELIPQGQYIEADGKKLMVIHNFSADKETTLEITDEMIPNAKVCADFLGSADDAHLELKDGKITMPAYSSVVIRSAS